jgi:hypothetical protein
VEVKKMEERKIGTGNIPIVERIWWGSPKERWVQQVKEVLKRLAATRYGGKERIEIEYRRRKYPIELELEKRTVDGVVNGRAYVWTEWKIGVQYLRVDIGTVFAIFPEGCPAYDMDGTPYLRTVDEAAEKIGRWIAEEMLPRIESHRRLRAAMAWAERGL